MNFKISHFRVNELYKLSKFIKENYKDNHIFCRDKKFLRWEHVNKKKLSFIYLKIKNEVVAILGYKSPLNHDQKLSNNVIFLTLALTSKKAPPGSLKLLFENLKKKKKLIITMGFNHKTLMYQKLLGFKIFKLNHCYLKSKNIQNFKIIKVDKNNKKNFVKQIKKNIEIHNVSSVKEIINLKKNKEIWNNFKPMKSSQYLISRYMDHPIYNYNLSLIIKDKKKIAIVVSREINFKKRKIIKIVDYFGSNYSLKYLSNFSEKMFLDNSLELIEFYNYGIDIKILKRIGFNTITNKKEIIPRYFEPFVKKNIEVLGGILNFGKFKNIRIFVGDGDQDRPS